MDEKKISDLTLEEYRKVRYRTKLKNKEFSIVRAKSLKEQGMSTSDIGRELGVSEATVYLWLNRSK